MRKSARFFIFLAAFLAALAVCLANAKKINADIFSLVNFENSTASFYWLQIRLSF